MSRWFVKLIAIVSLVLVNTVALAGNGNLPDGFVYLSNVAPDILQDIRYDSYHNFLGRPVDGYDAAECVLTVQAAQALVKVEAELKSSNLSLKVYDCYRPQRAVNDFIRWSQDSSDNKMKAEFYPRVDKADLFTLGYIAAKSGHTRGSTVDVTIVPIPTLQQQVYYRGQALVACYASYMQRFRDNSIDMGTGYDCLDTTAYPLTGQVSITAHDNRMLLRNIMQKYGFAPYNKEWWHFTLVNEPYPDTYFTFPIVAKG